LFAVATLLQNIFDIAQLTTRAQYLIENDPFGGANDKPTGERTANEDR
jgi:hypothetical protein